MDAFSYEVLSRAGHLIDAPVRHSPGVAGAGMSPMLGICGAYLLMSLVLADIVATL